MAEISREEKFETVSKNEEPELEEEVLPPVATPKISEEAVDDFKEELRKIDNEKQRKKDALKARVKAAQERARMAQRKQAQQRAQIRREEEKILNQLEGETKSAPSSDKIPVVPPPVIQQQKSEPLPPPPPLPPTILQDSIKEALQTNTMDQDDLNDANLPPPSYDMFDQLTMKPPVTHNPTQSFLKQLDLPPPSPPPILLEREPPEFEKLPSAPPIPVPGGQYQPPVQNLAEENLPPPPSFQQYEEDEIMEAVNNTEDTERLVREQTAILEQLEAEKAANDAAIAEAATSDLFSESNNDAAIAAAATTDFASKASSTKSSKTKSRSSTQRGAGNTIEIGPNTRVTLRGEEQTRAAIDAGTAMIVQCLSCHNWMQVANTATLMFCPSCSTISRVEPQDQVTSLEEARILMAHKRKKEKKEEKERKLKEYKEMSWAQYVKSFFVTESSEGTSTRTPSTSDYSSSSSQQLDSVQTYGREDYDEYNGREESTQSLLPVQTFQTDRNPPARIAERRPLHSCLTGLSKTLTGGSGYPGRRGQGNDDIDGIDSSALLSVTRVGRNTT